jgi:hypothetical protein
MHPQNEMKSILLEILEMAFQAPDINATQQLGVQLSNAVKRDGVVIIQNQNVEVYAKIMPSMVKALRLCDSFEVINHEPLQIENVKVEDAREPITLICEWFFNNNYKWEAMQDFMRLSYINYVISQFNTKRESAEFLGIGPTYLSKISAKELS